MAQQSQLPNLPNLFPIFIIFMLKSHIYVTLYVTFYLYLYTNRLGKSGNSENRAK